MLRFTERTWADEIAVVLNTREFHNARITILDPNRVTTTWDIETNTQVTVGDPVIVSNIPARINWPLRSIADPGSRDYDPTTVRSGRVSIDYDTYSGELRNGMQVLVTDGGRNPDFVRYRFRVSEAQNDSWMVSRVFKITVDAEATSGSL